MRASTVSVGIPPSVRGRDVLVLCVMPRAAFPANTRVAGKSAAAHVTWAIASYVEHHAGTFVTMRGSRMRTPKVSLFGPPRSPWTETAGEPRVGTLRPLAVPPDVHATPAHPRISPSPAALPRTPEAPANCMRRFASEACSAEAPRSHTCGAKHRNRGPVTRCFFGWRCLSLALPRRPREAGGSRGRSHPETR